MRRDWDLIRNLLFEIEESTLDEMVEPDCFPELDRGTVGYHISLIVQAGFAFGEEGNQYGNMEQSHATELTWAGHELIDKIRNDTLWNKTKDAIQKKGIGMSFDLIKSCIGQLLAQVDIFDIGTKKT